VPGWCRAVPATRRRCPWHRRTAAAVDASTASIYYADLFRHHPAALSPATTFSSDLCRTATRLRASARPSNRISLERRDHAHLVTSSSRPSDVTVPRTPQRGENMAFKSYRSMMIAFITTKKLARAAGQYNAWRFAIRFETVSNLVT